MHSLALILGGLLPIAQGATPISWANINACLRGSGVPIDEQGSIDWNRDAAAYNGAVNCGRGLNIKVSAKAGGHSYTSGGFGGENGHLVVQLDRMHNVTLDPTTNIATVQPGTRVGASGHMTSGDYGMSSHKYGLALDIVEGATVVLANGSAVETSATQYADLFWAIRGRGAELRHRGVLAAPDLRGASQADLVPRDARLDPENGRGLPGRRGDGRPFAEGLFYGDESQMKSSIAPFLAAANGSLTTYQQVNWLDAIKHYSVDNTFNTTANDVVVDYVEPGPPDNFFAKSLTLNGLNGKAAQAFVDYWYGVANKVDRRWFFQIDAAGGPNSNYSKPGNGATAFAHRDKTFIIQFYDAVGSSVACPSNGLSLLNDWVSNITAALPPGTGSWRAYANYRDPTLSRGEAQRLYYGANLERLRRLKLQYDPDERFYFPQSIEPWRNQSSATPRLH
ncbi:hypothetical protein PG994_004408 [Apiospora phragmitis]|uniref:FAD-binding PCMH-type domain-containing protein n=1 Tax=Apiospora phragmitis TaxID=2905665 RepID=A0ABR1VQI3_9PEZI